MSERRRFVIASAKEQFSRLYPIIAEIVEEIGLEGEEKFRFAVCVSEAFTNAFFHGNQANPDRQVELTFSWDAESFWAEIGDQGAGRLRDIDLNLAVNSIPTEETSGRGVAIITKFADKVEVAEKDGGGLLVKMIWRRQTRPLSRTSVS